MSTFKYKAFISYSHADSGHAEWLLKALEAYKIPANLVGRVTEHGPIPERLAPIFRDRDELPAAGRMTERLFDALQSSEFMIVLCSPKAAQSKLVNREIAEFKSKRDDAHILGLIVDGIPFSDDPARECFPDALQHSFHTDGVKAGLSAEGLAADIRPEADGKRMGLMKIIAGMLGVGLNDIVQRDEKRRQQRLTIGIAVTAVSLFAMGCLTYEAISARNDAELARMIAESKAGQLQIARDEGENLVSFLTTTVFLELQKAGRIEALDAIVRRVLEFYSHQPSSIYSEETIRYRTVALFRLGQTIDRMGDSETAEEIFTQALEQTTAAYSASPNNPVIMHRHQIALFFSAYLDQRLGLYEQALQKYKDRLMVAQRGAKLDPELTAWGNRLKDYTTWEDQIAETETSIGTLLAEVPANYTEGIWYITSGIERRKQLVADKPESLVRNLRLASSISALAKVQRKFGKFAATKVSFMAAIAIYEQMALKDPSNLQIRRSIYIGVIVKSGVLGFHQAAFRLF